MKFVIRAGGIGTRLWPYSRRTNPKQFHSLVGGRSMLQEALERVRSLAGPQDLYVSTGTDLVDGVRAQLPELAPECVIAEPALRNTGPAVGLECALLEARYPGCTIASLGSDHHIGKPEEFRRLLTTAEKALDALPDCLVTIGVKPSRVETGFGYIHKGEVRARIEGEPLYEVSEFKEKPDQDLAGAYVQSGEYLWNSNMFVWKASTMLKHFAEYEPEISDRLDRIQNAVGTPHEADVIREEYPKMKEIAVDNAILERADDVLALEADIDWSDIGSWGAITDVLPVDAEGNLASAKLLSLGARNDIVYAPEGKLVALIDVHDMIVIDTPDALLICPKDRSQKVRDVVDRLRDDSDLECYS